MKPSTFGVFLLGMTAICSPSLVFAQVAPTVQAGAATITQTPGKTVVNQTTNRAAIDWQAFGVKAGESVQFVQPSASSIALNRVTGADVSRIDGSLISNGQVWLSNPNGVLFGAGSQVNVGGLLATTGQIDRDRMMARGEALISSTTGAPININAILKSVGSASIVGKNVRVGVGGGIQVGSVNLIGAGGATIANDVVLQVDPATAARISALGGLSGSRILIVAPGGTAEIGEKALGSDARMHLIGRPGPDAHGSGYVVGADGEYAGLWQAQARSLTIGGRAVPVAPVEGESVAVVAAAVIPAAAPSGSPFPTAVVALAQRTAATSAELDALPASRSVEQILAVINRHMPTVDAPVGSAMSKGVMAAVQQVAVTSARRAEDR